VAACLLLAACSAGQAAAPAAAPDYVATAQGRIDAASELRWLAAEIDAPIVAIPVAEGDPVKAGQPLLHLACADRIAAAQAAAGQAEAAAAQQRLVAEGPRAEARAQAVAHRAAAAAELADAQDQLNRARALEADGWVSKRRIEQAQTAVAAAAGRRDAADAALAAIEHGARPDERRAASALAGAAAAAARQAAADADRCTIRSPIAGTVLRILKREGEFSGSGQASPIIAVADLSRLMVRVEVLDRDAARVQPGMAAVVWLDETPGRWQGRVLRGAGIVGRRTARSLDPADRFDRDVREVQVLLDGPAPALLGLRVNVGFVAGERPA
jgi:multidrug resistance efflux pump